MKASELFRAIENLKHLGLDKSYNDVYSQIDNFLTEKGINHVNMNKIDKLNCFIAIKTTK